MTGRVWGRQGATPEVTSQLGGPPRSLGFRTPCPLAAMGKSPWKAARSEPRRARVPCLRALLSLVFPALWGALRGANSFLPAEAGPQQCPRAQAPSQDGAQSMGAFPGEAAGRQCHRHPREPAGPSSAAGAGSTRVATASSRWGCRFLPQARAVALWGAGSSRALEVSEGRGRGGAEAGGREGAPRSLWPQQVAGEARVAVPLAPD